MTIGPLARRSRASSSSSAASGSTGAVNASVPSGLKRGAPAPSGRWVSCSGSPPSRASRKTWAVPSCFRKEGEPAPVRRPDRGGVGRPGGEPPGLAAVGGDEPQRALGAVLVDVQGAQDVDHPAAVRRQRRRLGHGDRGQVVDAQAARHARTVRASASRRGPHSRRCAARSARGSSASRPGSALRPPGRRPRSRRASPGTGTRRRRRGRGRGAAARRCARPPPARSR